MQVFGNEIGRYQQFAEYEGRIVPWYLLPFKFTRPVSPTETPVEEIFDPFEEQRKLWDEVVASVNHTLSAKQKQWSPLVEDIAQYTRCESYYRLIQLNPAFAAHYVGYVRAENSRLMLFTHWTWIQRRLYWAFCADWYYDRPVMILVLKARQMGISTLIEWLLFWQAALQEDASNQNAIMMADKDGNAGRIFAMAERFYTHLDKSMDASRIPVRQNSSGWKIAFGVPRRAFITKKKEKKEIVGPVLNSSIEVTTAAAKMTEKGLTGSGFHGSEYAFWPNGAETWEFISQGLPNVARTMVVLETTANIAGDFCHKMWSEAEHGNSDFVPLFDGWLTMPFRWQPNRMKRKKDEPSGSYVRKYSRSLPSAYVGADPDTDRQLREKYYRRCDREEQELVTRHGATLEQIEWRRRTIATKCSGDPERFKRQYPTTAAEAFRSQGRGVFARDAVEHYIDVTSPLKHQPPLFHGYFEANDKNEVTMVRDSEGETKIWRLPEPNQVHIVGCDPAGGEDPDSDHSSIQVFNARTLEQVAHCFTRQSGRMVAYQAQCLSFLYAPCLVVSEINGLGYRLTSYLTPDGHYPVENLYVRQSYVSTSGSTEKKYGFHSNKHTKPKVVNDTMDLFNNLMLNLHCPETARQASIYTRHADLSYGKPTPKESDDAMDALMLVVVGLQSEQLLNIGFTPEKRTDTYSSLDDEDAWQVSVKRRKTSEEVIIHPQLGVDF